MFEYDSETFTDDESYEYDYTHDQKLAFFRSARKFLMEKGTPGISTGNEKAAF